MFEPSRPKTHVGGAGELLSLIYHATVRDIRKSHGNALIGLLLNMMQTVIFVLAFYVMFTVLGLRTNAVRGDFLLYIMSGVFLFLTHTKALSAVVKSEGPASPMMQHAPMNTIIAISAAALGSLYIQILSMVFVMFVYHAAVTPIHIHDPVGAMGMLLLAWFSGVTIGLVFLAVKPWFPGFVGIASTIYARANMIASGKMFVVNMLPPSMYTMFAWNPLFHNIDQARGFVFINYFPHKTSLMYPIYFGICLVVLGLIGEFYTRRHASLSWSARR